MTQAIITKRNQDLHQNFDLVDIPIYIAQSTVPVTRKNKPSLIKILCYKLP